MKHLKNSKGFTLIELLAGITLTALIMSALALMFTTLLSPNAKTVLDVSMQRDARWAVDTMAREIAAATLINTPDGKKLQRISIKNAIGEDVIYALGERDASPVYAGTLYRRVGEVANPVTEQTTRGVVVSPNDLSFTLEDGRVDIVLTLTSAGNRRVEAGSTIVNMPRSEITLTVR